MSKTSLKRMLAQMTREQIAELVVELYEARPEAKDYLDFFVQPDIAKRLDKAKAGLRKELMRTSRGRNRARVTRVRRFIKDISSLNPGTEPVLEVMAYAVETAAAAGSTEWVKDSVQRAVAGILTEMLRAADAAGMLDVYLPRMERAVGSMPSRGRYSGEYKALLKAAIDDVFADAGC